MKFKLILITWIVFGTSLLFGQQSINAYKYIIVPKNYDFLRLEDQYQLNSLTKFLFTKEGFNAYFDSENKPQDLNSDPCLALNARVISNSSMITTKLLIELVDCKNEIIFTSEEGLSKLKEYKKAYYQALRKAFNSIQTLNYQYNPSEVSSTPVKVDKTAEISKGRDIEPNDRPLNQINEPNRIDNEKQVSIDNKTRQIEPSQKQSNKTDNQLEQTEEIIAPPVNENSKEQPTLEAQQQVQTAEDILFAHETGMGYQLVDRDQKLIYELIRTSKPDVYFIKNISGIIYKIGQSWMIEFIDQDQLIKKELDLQFKN